MSDGFKLTRILWDILARFSAIKYRSIEADWNGLNISMTLIVIFMTQMTLIIDIRENVLWLCRIYDTPLKSSPIRSSQETGGNWQSIEADDGCVINYELLAQLPCCKLPNNQMISNLLRVVNYWPNWTTLLLQ